MNNQLPAINIQTVQVALATFITNLITGIISNLAAWSKLPLVPVNDQSGLVSILSVMASALLATALVGWFTRTMATLQAMNTTPGVNVSVNDPATAEKAGVPLSANGGK